MAGMSGKITFWGMEVFVAAAEEGSISAAARRLNTSPATVSQQLTNLESALQSTLMDRAARPVGLTPSGAMFLRRANVILSEAEQARSELAMADLARLTRFRLGMIEDFDADVTPRLLSGLAERLSKCRFLLETGPSHRLHDLLETRALDMIVAADIGTLDPALEMHALMREPFVVAAPKGRGATEDPGRLLSRMPLIQYTTRHHMGRQIAAHLARQNVTVAHRFELDSYHSIMAMVAEGAGWTILTPLGWLRAQRFRGAVDLLPLPFAPLGRSISLVARRGLLQDMPTETAREIRPLIEELIVRPATRDMPWLEGQISLS